MTAEMTRPTDAALLERLVRVETKLDMALTGMNSENGRSNGRLDDHERRLVKLERTIWFVAGAAAAIGSVAGSTLANILGVGG